MNKLVRLAGAAVLIAVVGVGLMSVAAHAQTPTPQNPASAVGDLVNQVWDAVAQKLGVARTDLDKAVKDAGQEVADQAAKDGKLTQQQADRMKLLMEKGPAFGMMGRWGHHGMMGGGMMGPCAGNQEALAKALGMTTDELSAALQSGKTIDQIAKEKGVDLQAVQKDAMKAQIEQAVKDGQLTQEQADWMLQGIDQGFMPGGKGFGMGGHGMRGFGMHEGFRGPWGENGQTAPTNPTTPDSSTTSPSSQGNA